MGRYLSRRWIALAELGLVFACAILLYFFPQLGAWPLLVALLAWVGVVVAGRFANLATPLDLPLLIFLAAASLGVWTTYNQPEGLSKLWLIAAGCLLYYALARQPGENLWLVAGLTSVFLALLAGYYLFTFDSFDAQPLNLALAIPSTAQPGTTPPISFLANPEHDTAEGLIAILAPFSIALGIYAWRKRNPAWGLIALAALLLTAGALFLGSSLAALLALLAALGLSFLWLLSGYLPGLSLQWRGALIGFVLLLLIALGLVLVAFYPDWIADQVNRLAGPGRAASQLEVNLNTVLLIPDFLFTGGGLAAFPGLYSQYIMNLPVYLYGYSYSLFLDVSLEQGIIGLASLTVILAGSIWLVWKSKVDGVLKWAILAALCVMLVNGLADDPLYGGRGTPLLFLLPGLAIAGARYNPRGESETSSGIAASKPVWVFFTLAFLLVAGYLAFVLTSSRLGAWYSNLGAVQMARVELADFPSGGWQDGESLSSLAPAEALFNQALQRHPGNFAANYRLGLFAMYRRDYSLAKSYLERAHLEAPRHRGVRKVLGYCHVWLGEFDEAGQFLNDIPEAGYELEAYSWWWATQGREDLSAYAAQMAATLQ
jgi:tetratricopeptide (TPR) repeat protein